MGRSDYESPDMAAFIGRTIRAMVRRAGEGDLEAISALAQVRRATEQAERDAAAVLRAAGYSWADIGRELGITRQSAQQRLGV